jgi:hypothetical protein
MTGPRTSTVHPLPRRPWLLLPFLASVAFLLVGCSDQPTEPFTSTKPVAAVVSHPVRKPAGSRISASQSTAPKPLMSFSVAQAVSGTGKSVLVLADTDVVSTTALANSLADAGLQVTVRPGPEYTWDGTNPSLNGFDVVIHLNGSSYEAALPEGGQSALANFVSNGGGYIGSKWNGFEFQPQMENLTLQGFGDDPFGPAQTCGHCEITYETAAAGAGHPVLAGLPASFTFTADGHDAGPQTIFASNPSTVLMQVPNGGAAVLVRELGAGRIVNFSFAPNYYWDDLGSIRDPVTLQDATIQQLYINAVEWTSAGSTGTIQPQTITFAPLQDKVYGDPAFTLDATASSGLPVNYTASGSCGVLGVNVTLTGAGSCTITAHQAGNESYEPAADVSQSFEIAKAIPTIQWQPGRISVGTMLGPAHLNAVAYGVGGVTLSGSFVYNPPAGTKLKAGTQTLSVLFTPADANYTGASLSVTITVEQGFKGFHPPVKNAPTVNVVSAGSSVPIKFTLVEYMGTQVLSGAPTSIPVQCGSGPESTISPTSSLLPGGLTVQGYSYTYRWRTDASWAGTCRKFIMRLADGSTHEALFRFPARSNQATTARRILLGW